MSIIRCPKVVAREYPDAAEAERWGAWFAGLPLAPFRARTRGRAVLMAEEWWAERQAERMKRLARNAARAENLRRRARA